MDKQARGDATLKKYYLGCFPADVKPDVRDKCCWIWNVDEQDKSGTHWVGVIKDSDKIIFFDSYGKPPTFFKRKYWAAYIIHHYNFSALIHLLVDPNNYPFLKELLHLHPQCILLNQYHNIPHFYQVFVKP